MAGVASQSSPQWSSRFAFIMAAVGSSVGLGNLWRFSAEAGRNGGGAFILVYLACVLLIGIPVLMSEFIIGRSGNASSAIRSVNDVADRSHISRGWNSLAWVGMIASFLIVSFYCVVAAWVMMYIPKFLFGSFDGQTAEQISSQFGDMITTPKGLKGFFTNDVLLYFTAFALLTTFLVARGVNKGIELAAKVLMPMFFVLLIALAIYSLSIGYSTKVLAVDGKSSNGAWEAIKFLFTPDASKITPEIASRALGQAFFSIGLGSAIMITYGSYLPKDISIPKSALIIGLTDTSVALIAGLAIFPIVFAHGLDVKSGAGLFFETLPVALSNAPLIGAAFFFLAIFAAVTSSVSLLEPAVAWVIERFNMSRYTAALTVGGLMWLVGLASVKSLAFMDLIDQGITGTIMLPLSGLLVVLLVGWRLKRKILYTELGDAVTKLDKPMRKDRKPPMAMLSFQGLVVVLLAMLLVLNIVISQNPGGIKFFVSVIAIAAFLTWAWLCEDYQQASEGYRVAFYVKIMFFLVRYVAPLFVAVVLLFGFYGKYFSG
ncbi:MAG: sodium-dependent transporter [Robiginitomaculum sp.]|nr:sodium-dependent transporter [Robiginitomaculum sp.]